MTNLIGWLGVVLGMLVPIPQIIKLFRTGKVRDISLGTYVLLILAMGCYLLHALAIRDVVFITAQAINIMLNSIVLVYILLKRKYQKISMEGGKEL